MFDKIIIFIINITAFHSQKTSSFYNFQETLQTEDLFCL